MRERERETKLWFITMMMQRAIAIYIYIYIYIIIILTYELYVSEVYLSGDRKIDTKGNIYVTLYYRLYIIQFYNNKKKQRKREKNES